ncbi:MAG: acyltransferase family protein, partial [Ilumatobacteraceae bacterium]
MFRRDIEGLRAIAVGMVLLHHAHFLGLDGGFIGVDVFFVVSGFLITGLLLREHADNGRISIPAFYARRARRILPASAVVIVTTALASWYWLDPLRVREVGSDVVGSGGFFANIVFAARATDYLQAESAPSPLQHFWSLSVEEQFYIAWPALLLVLLMASRGRRLPAAIAIGLISAESLVLCVLQTESSQPWAFFGLHTRAWELGVGALVALGWSRIERAPMALRAALGWAGLITVVAAAFLLSTKVFFPGWLALLPVLGTAAVITAGDDHPRGPTVVLRNRARQWVGSRSYSLYLWHWPALIIAEGRAGGALSSGERIGALLIACGAAELSYRLVENPIRHARLFTERTRPALGLGAVLVAASILTGVLLRADGTALATETIATLPVVPVPGDPERT